MFEEKPERVVSQDAVGTDLFQGKPERIYQSRGGGGVSKRLDGIIGCKDKTSSWHLIGFPVGSNIGSEI